MKTAKTAMVLLLGAALAGPAGLVVYAQEGPPGAWQPQEPQGNWSEVWHRGFHAGVDAARHDIDAGRPPDPRRHEEFRHPHDMPPDQRHDFREGFRRGYRMVYEHHGHGG